MKRTAIQKILYVLFIVSIGLSLIVPIKAAEDAESNKVLYQRFLSYLDLKYINEKIPFLLKTEWDQAGIYAKYTPAKIRVGCWSTAAAQILYYHRLLPHGKVSYQCTEGYKIIENLNSYSFNWDLFVNKIDDHTPTESIEQVAKYSYFVAVVMRKDFGVGGHVGFWHDGFFDSSYFVEMLQENYDCNVKAHIFRDNTFLKDKDEIQKIIKNEIEASRPVIFHFGAGTNGHAVVIDGFSEQKGLFLVHINQGLGGMGNGVYNLFRPMAKNGVDMERRDILTIKPSK